MLRRLLSLSLVSAVVAVLAGCYQIDADITVDSDGLMDGTIVIELDPTSDYDLSSIEFFEPGDEPNGLRRVEIDEPDRQAIELTFRNQPASEALKMQSPLQDVPFLVIAGLPGTSDLSIIGTSLTEQFCAQEEDVFAAMQSFWDVEVTIEFERGVFFSGQDDERIFTEVVGDGGVFVWRPQFGDDTDLQVLIVDPVSPAGVGGRDDLLPQSGCGNNVSYIDLPAIYPAPTRTPTAEPSAETTEEPTAEPEETATEEPQGETDSEDSDSTVDGGEEPALISPADEAEDGAFDSTTLIVVLLLVLIALLTGVAILLLRNSKKDAGAPPTE